MKPLVLLPLALLVLAACDPQDLADKAIARTAEAVVAPVTNPTVARCVVENATPEELRALARDVGVEAGTSTRARIAEIALRPATMACVAAEGGRG